MPEVRLEPHSNPCKQRELQKTYAIRPGPARSGTSTTESGAQSVDDIHTPNNSALLSTPNDNRTPNLRSAVLLYGDQAWTARTGSPHPDTWVPRPQKTGARNGREAQATTKNSMATTPPPAIS